MLRTPHIGCKPFPDLNNSCEIGHRIKMALHDRLKSNLMLTTRSVYVSLRKIKLSRQEYAHN